MSMLSSELMAICANLENKYLQEEFAGTDSQFDLGYCRYLLKTRTLTKGMINSAALETLGHIVIPTVKVKNEVSEELFAKHYRFGKYQNCRQWISFFERRYSLLLTRATLFKYVLKA